MRWLVAILLTLLLGCQEEERAPWAPSLQSGTTTSTTGKPMREVLERGLADDKVLLCDIRMGDCQQRIFDTTVAVRGGTAPRPPVTVVSRDDFSDQLTQDAQAAVPDAALRTLIALGLVSPALVASDLVGGTADAVLAAYFFESKKVVVIDHGRPLDTIEASLTLSHEFVHALQDGQHDLLELSRAATTTDQHEGLLGLIEGEAEVYAALAITGEVKTESRTWKRIRRAVVDGVLETDAPFFAADLNFPYTFGTEWVTKTYAADGSDAVAQRYDAIPSGSREIMAGFGAEVPPAGWGEAVEGTAQAAVEEGYEPVFEDAFGAWVLHVFLEAIAPRGIPRLPGESAASALRGDRVTAWERDGRLVVAWQLRFDAEIDPAAVADEITAAHRSGLLARVEAGDVVVFASQQVVSLDAFAASFVLPPR